MAKLEQVVTLLQKLYDKRSALDKQIIEAEKKLVSEVKAGVKPAAAAKKTVAKKAVKKTAAKLTAAKSAPKK